MSEAVKPLGEADRAITASTAARMWVLLRSSAEAAYEQFATLTDAPNLFYRVGLMLLRGYFDDSKGEGEDAYLSLAGYIAPDDAWEAFEPKWQQALERAGVPWLHLKEFGSPTGIYSKWYSGQHEDEKIAFFQSLIN